MVSGTDEHGTPIQVQADAEGVTARELADRYNRVIAEDLPGLDMSYDLFTRTTTRNHYAVVQEMFTGLYDNGYIFRARPSARSRRPPAGRCPTATSRAPARSAATPSARGDQCDNCGNQLDPADLINPRSRINGETPAFVETEQFFLDLPAFADALGHLAAEQERPVAAQRAEVLAQPARRPPAAGDHPRPGLGRPDPARRLAGPPGQADLRLVRRGDRLPVRVDRVGPARPATRTPGGPWWQTPDAESYYFMGKDNIVFHSEIWPAMLLGYGGKGARGGTPGSLGALNLPSEVVSSEYLTMEGRKFSSSRVGRHLRPRLPGPLQRGRAALLRRRGRARRTRTPTSPGASSSAATTTSWWPNWGNLVNRAVSFAASNIGVDPGGRRR